MESQNRGTDLTPAYASGLSPPTSANREYTGTDVSHSTVVTTCADLPSQYVETHVNLTHLSNIKQSAQGTIHTTRADIAHTKVRHTDLKVDWGQKSTHIQAGVISLSPMRPAEQQMVPPREQVKNPQTLFGATAEFVALSSPTPSQRSTFSMRPSHAHRILPHRSAFSTTTFLGTGREVNDVAEAKTQSTTTTTVGTVVGYDRKSVSKTGQVST